MALSEAEFDRLVTDHGAVLYRTAFRMVGDRGEAEDLVQETFRSCWKSRALFRPGEGERAWLIAILRRRSVDRWRRRRLPSVLRADLSDDIATQPPDPTQDDYTDEMQRALNRLPKELREALLLVVVGELTHQEAAEEMRCPIGTILSRVSRARERLRQFMLAEKEK